MMNYETYNSLETALYFAIKGEEMLNYRCQRLFDSTRVEQSGEYENLCEDWRKQKKLCEVIAKQLWLLNPDFKDNRFESDDVLGTYGVSCLKPFRQRESEGTLVVKFSKV